jgi:hypothetical protein
MKTNTLHAIKHIITPCLLFLIFAAMTLVSDGLVPVATIALAAAIRLVEAAIRALIRVVVHHPPQS